MLRSKVRARAPIVAIAGGDAPRAGSGPGAGQTSRPISHPIGERRHPTWPGPGGGGDSGRHCSWPHGTWGGGGIEIAPGTCCLGTCSVTWHCRHQKMLHGAHRPALCPARIDRGLGAAPTVPSATAACGQRRRCLQPADRIGWAGSNRRRRSCRARIRTGTRHGR